MNNLEKMETMNLAYSSYAEKVSGYKAKYTFVGDMYLILNDQSQMQKYLDEVLNDICKHDVQAYSELIDSVNYLEDTINFVLVKDLKDTCYDFLTDPEKTMEFLHKFLNQMVWNKAEIQKYLTDAEHKEFIDILNGVKINPTQSHK